MERSRRRSASREYRTYFHIGQSWGVNESTAYRIIRKIEDTLTKSRTFTLPAKKRLTNSDYKLQVVIVDVTESPIERTKKKQKRFYSVKIECLGEKGYQGIQKLHDNSWIPKIKAQRR